MDDRPLVSCVMPTKDRRPFIRSALDCWLKQTYEPLELVIVDDGADKISDLIPADPRIRYFVEPHPPKRSTGRKRNYCNELAKGPLVCHFDDDDWSAPDRISDQVSRLLETGLPVTGYGTLLFWDTVKQMVRRYRATSPGYVCGTSLCYRKDYWETHKFPDKQVASDNAFIYPALAKKQIATSHDMTKLVARIHDCHHTSTKNGIVEQVSRDLVPSGFWLNEELRLS